MRPPVGEAQSGPSRSRKASTLDPSAFHEEHGQLPSSAPMTFFLADESTVNSSLAGLATPGSSYGVRSLENSIGSEPRIPPPPESSTGVIVEGLKETLERVEKGAKRYEEDTDLEQGLHDADTSFDTTFTPHEHSRSLTRTPSHDPSFRHMPSNSDLASLYSEDQHFAFNKSPLLRSYPGSELNMDDRNSAIADDLEDTQVAIMPKEEDFTEIGAPQLIMPTIKMPSRRPFTDRGKAISRLKILMAGDSGIGKTTLIKSIVQACEDIVHVDPVGGAGSTFGGSREQSSYYTISSRADGESTKRLVEVYASTRPYPKWWSEFDESKVLRRRKSSSSGESVLERNLCFVDTPGYGFGTSCNDCIDGVVRYVESQLERTSSMVTSGDGDLLTLLSGSGAPHVDVVFYVILHRLKPVDIEYIRRLSVLTNVMPIIAKADTLNDQQIHSLKLSIVNDLRAAGIKPFLFGKSYEDIERGDGPCPPFAISSAIDNDIENMDASILMSPDYIPPLVSTELGDLVSHVFDPENVSWLKHAAAKKYINWKLSNSIHASQHQLSLSYHSPNFHSTSMSPSASISPLLRPSPSRPGSSGFPGFSTSSSLIHMPVNSSPTQSFVLARVADHTQREERLAQVRLARWASDLQRSLKAERERYEQLAKGERAIWLTERLGECVKDGTLVPAMQGELREVMKSVEERDCYKKDPLGLVSWVERVKERGRVLGISGGAVALCAAIWALKEYGAARAAQEGWVI
ncbi:hypothetical protein BJ508DRAFT_30286 [Ascobolus immersus RN42]|uniref:Septin-type G domain-containing protein n=1 Tax=Ascobolus immersus RN42 TaxID=1160509 RepID=A0A3N4HLK3_ASCIM|nr:hypothetical protein BJ508DRAFT_30286 [Ascobolus immersus RN42]